MSRPTSGTRRTYPLLDHVVERRRDRDAEDGPRVSRVDYPVVLADLCRYITLLPGDVVLTGTPAHSRPMQPGDVVEVEISDVGRLSNTVVESPAAAHAVGHQPTDSIAVRAVALGSDLVRDG